MLDENVKMGIIAPHNGEWASPAFLVEKEKKGTYRIVNDVRQLNMQLERSSWPLSTADDIFSRLAGATYISTFDLEDGFPSNSTAFRLS